MEGEIYIVEVYYICYCVVILLDDEGNEIIFLKEK